jgi:hypothetical protein
MSDAPDRDGAVTVAYVHSNDCSMSWHHSLMEMVNYDMGNQGRIMRGGWAAIHAGTGGLVEARNMAVEAFLKDRIGEWLYWTDTDMGFEPDTVDRLFQAADALERPIVGALCYALREYEPDGMGGHKTGLAPTIYDWTIDGEHKGFAVRWRYSKNTLTRCSGTGSACVLIHRSVFEKIEKEFGPIWYERIRNPTTDQLIGEDLSFCMRAGKLDIPVFVHTGVKASHAKLQWLAEENYDAQLMAEAMRDAIREKVEPTAVIVPVLNRPQNAEPFMRSLRASSGDKVTAYAVANNADSKTIVAWTKAGAKIIGTNQHTFAEKVNEAHRITTEPWELLVGDDVRFHPGWLEAAQSVGVAGASVVGTNDLGNPRVLAGEHTCHPLIRRSYIDEVGASWDGPGIVAHPYHHWFVDDEIVTAAKQRGVWGFAKDSVIEHMHPLWKKGAMDKTYELGASKAEADKALFKERLEKFAAVPVG